MSAHGTTQNKNGEETKVHIQQNHACRDVKGVVAFADLSGAVLPANDTPLPPGAVHSYRIKKFFPVQSMSPWGVVNLFQSYSEKGTIAEKA
jgi:hypothetical protein